MNKENEPIHIGNAEDIEYHIGSLGIRNIDHVVSGIPLVSCGEDTREKICEGVLNLINRGGSFVQVTYFGFCPIPQKLISKYNSKRIFSGAKKSEGPTRRGELRLSNQNANKWPEGPSCPVRLLGTLDRVGGSTPLVLYSFEPPRLATQYAPQSFGFQSP